MNKNELFSLAPGSRVLLACKAEKREEMLTDITSSIPQTIRDRAALNTAPVLVMDMNIDPRSPDSFEDLIRLCSRLVTAAGRRSRFEGLLILNIAGLRPEGNGMCLRALGEFLAQPKGLSSRCVTMVCGPEDEKELVEYAGLLDFDGRLRVDFHENSINPSLGEIIEQMQLRCEDTDAEQMLKSMAGGLQKCDGFHVRKFLGACSDLNGNITAETIQNAAADPYSYVNRIKGERKKETGRVIGFESTH